MKRIRQMLAILLALMLFLTSNTLLPAANQREVGQNTIYLPVIQSARLSLSLEHIGTVREPIDIIDTEYGVLVTEADKRIINLGDNSAFLDLTSRTQNIRLQSLVLHQGELYVIYMILGEEYTQYLSKFTIENGRATAESEQILLTIPASTKGRHFGADLNIGPDGYLYVATGDGSPLNDPARNAQNKKNLFGAILRLDIDGGGLPSDCDPNGNYTIPADNPFVDGSGQNCDELWVVGLRQPWRVSFDRQTGDLWMSDVGWNHREEINVQPASSSGGENYGWNCYEGTWALDLTGCEKTYETPYYEYETTDPRCAIIGGFVYRGSAFPSLIGQYVFADYCSGEIMALNANRQLQILLKMEGALWDTFAEKADGELYVADYLSGKVYLIGASRQ